MNVASDNVLNFRDEAHADAAALFGGHGEVRFDARELDWTTTALGPTIGWSPALRTMARTIFDSPFPICLWSGPNYALVYNDAYRRILSAKHPAALGQPGSVVTFAPAIMSQCQKFDGDLAGLPLGQLLDESVESPSIFRPGKELVAIDQPQKRHRLFAQGMNDVVIVDDLIVLAFAWAWPRGKVSRCVPPM